MAQLILHHFDASPFAEKVRLAMGLKGLAWHSVEIPMVMPKPDLMPLTGGYRKTPTLQIGADVYCDTRHILLELERRHPQPSLFPSGNRGMALALSHWSDTAFFEPGAGLAMGVNTDLPEPLLKDRMAFFNFMDFSTLAESLPHLYGQFIAQADLIEQQLSDGRAYLFGDRPDLADINAYFPVWMGRGNVPDMAAWLQGFTRMAGWEKRMGDIGHGQREELSPRAALDIARDANPAEGGGVDGADPQGFQAGDRVTVTPDDYGQVPVTGTLIALTRQAVTLRRADPRVGEVNTHFPRAGYCVEKA